MGQAVWVGISYCGLSEQDVNVLLSQRFNIAQRQKLVNILLWYGVIGVIR